MLNRQIVFTKPDQAGSKPSPAEPIVFHTVNSNAADCYTADPTTGEVILGMSRVEEVSAIGSIRVYKAKEYFLEGERITLCDRSTKSPPPPWWISPRRS